MCGIVGIVTKERSAFSYKHRQIFEQMLFMDTLRGEDSTGIFGVTKAGNVEWWKDVIPAPDFLTKPVIKQAMTNIIWDYVAMVGHNRKATKGTIKDENAHPFAENKIVLVHNGTLTNHKTLNNEVEVDSHAIVHAIEDHGIEKAIKKLDGAFALSFYDIDNKKLHLVRNKERPLFIAEFEKFWAFASEPWMIFGSAWRNELKPISLEELPVAKLLSFDFEESTTKLTTKEVKLFEPKKTISTVYPFPAVVKEEGKKDFTGFLEYFRRDKVICFTPMTLVADKGGSRMLGKHPRFPEVVINCWMPDDKYTATEKVTLNTLSVITGRIVGHSANSNTGNKTVFVTDLMESVPLVTANGTLLDEEQIETMELTCRKCKEPMSESDLEDSYVKIRPSGNTTIICPVCVNENLTANKYWGGINAYKEACTSTVH